MRTLREMISRWELGPDDFVQMEGDPSERRIRDCPALSPLDDMLHDASDKVQLLRKGSGRRAVVLRELELLREYAEFNDSIFSVTCFLLGWLRYAENPSLARGLFLKAIERGYPFLSVARNNLAVTQIRLGDSAGRDNLILAANDPQRVPAALLNLARILQHLQSLGENAEEIANIKDLLRVARAEWRKCPPGRGEPASFALFLCDGDIPASFASETKTFARIQGQIEDILAEAEDCLRLGRLEQGTAHSARAAAEISRAREDLSRSEPRKVSPLKFLSVRLARLEKDLVAAREIRERQGLLDTFRKRLNLLEEGLQLRVPPADLVQQSEVLLNSARTDVERVEAARLHRECQGRVAKHLLQTANELLSSGEKDVAIGLLRRALGMESDLRDEIQLRLASVRRDELEKEIAHSISRGLFEEARVRIARLRSVHPIFEPLSRRLELQTNVAEASAKLDRIVAICGGSSVDRDAVIEARKLLGDAWTLQPDVGILKPIEAHVNSLGVKFGLPPITYSMMSAQALDVAPAEPPGPPPPGEVHENSPNSVTEEGGLAPPKN